MKLKIKNLAKIEEFEFEVNPLTIFVGQNGTHKSYVAHIVYELNKFNLNIDIFEEIKKNLNIEPKKFIEYINKNKIRESDITFDIDINIDDEIILEKQLEIKIDNNISHIINELKNILENLLSEYLNKTFNSETNILQKIEIKDDIKLNEKISIRFVYKKDQNNDEILINHFLLALLKYLLNFKISQKTFYFPASRTGFVLAFDEIVSGLFRDKLGGTPTNTKLTKPTKEFLQNFADIKIGKFEDHDLFNKMMKDKNIKKLIEYIQKNIIHGIIEEKKEHNYTKYYLNTNNKNLELHVTSSATVELLPIIVFLKHFITLNDKLLIIEEPEAHLHPKAQIYMARFIALMVNYGIKVLITTHSDYIINELNNLIKLNFINQKKKEKYYEKNDLSENFCLKPEQIAAYLFKEEKTKVKVKKLFIDEYGISNENIDEVLEELTENAILLNEWIDNE
ncbi:AAA family ATPase [Caminibacter pacificus]